jgi:ABC-type transport system involved in multi-copper enzyme maturation permease subunit
MALGGWLGPVHAFEWLTASRRWQMYALRSAFVGLLLVGLWFVWINHRARFGVTPIKDQAAIAREFYQSLVFIAMVMVLLAAPAATAGAICLDKARGTLLHVLVTDLADFEIVLGKLAARLVPVLGMIACSLPVVALGTLLGGIDPVALTGSFLVLVGMAVLGCTIALTLSVWGKKTQEVLLATYVVWILWFLAAPMWVLVQHVTGVTISAPTWLWMTAPFMLTVQANNPSDPFSPGLLVQVLFFILALLLSAGLVALTIRRLRPVIIRQWGTAERRRERRHSRRRLMGDLGPTLDGNPVLWYEWHRRRPSRWALIIWGIYAVLAIGFTVVAITMAFENSGGNRDLPAVISGFMACIGLLLLSVVSATSLSEERVRGSLDVLMATPLSTAQIVWGKWWGAFKSVPPLAVLPVLIAGSLAFRSDRWIGPPLILMLMLAYGAAITSLGLALATWIRQVGRVIALSVAAVVAVTVGSLPVIMVLFPHGDFGACVAMVSPFFGIGFFSAVIAGPPGPNEWPDVAFWAFFWIICYSIAASVLLAATLKSFDRCLGRMPERRGWPPPPVWVVRPRKPAKLFFEEPV